MDLIRPVPAGGFVAPWSAVTYLLQPKLGPRSLIFLPPVAGPPGTMAAIPY
jgi:hypothetical protein